MRTAEGEGKERKEENEDKSWGQTDREGRSWGDVEGGPFAAAQQSRHPQPGMLRSSAAVGVCLCM